MVCKLCIHNSKRFLCKGGIVRVHSKKGMLYPITCIKFDPMYEQMDLFGGAELGL